MIFVTVGTQLPFDRLVRAIDGWAGENTKVDVFGQIAHPGPEGHVPRNFAWVAHLEPAEFDRRFMSAEIVVAHAGMGSIIGALVAAKPIVILPRQASLGEQRNDHQLATARRFADRPGVVACMEEEEIGPALDRLLSKRAATTAHPIGRDASPELIRALSEFVRSG